VSTTQINTPDIGADSAEVIEILVAEGEQISADQSVIVLESDKASMEVPAPGTGRVLKIHVQVGDQLAEGDLIAELVSTDAAVEENAPAVETAKAESEAAVESPQENLNSTPATEAAPITTSVIAYQVPDIGSDKSEIIELSIAVGDSISEGDTICVAESDKASLEIPAEADGKVISIAIAVGDTVGQGDALFELEITQTAQPPTKIAATSSNSENIQAPVVAAKVVSAPVAQAAVAAPDGVSGSVYAGPAVRKLARELGVDLTKVPATGTRSRIVKDDLHNYVKNVLKVADSSDTGLAVPAAPIVNWSKFGEIRTEPMTKIQKITAGNMSRCWLNVPHVTQFDSADVTDVEEYRQGLKEEGAARGIKMSPVAFMIKLAAKALRENPKFNSSIHEDGQTIVYRGYCHIGLAVDTPAGLMVPVIRDADTKDIWELAADIIELATKAKEGKLKPNEMQGASFTISSLGAIGGTGFTPIVASPQVGILGVSKTSIQPVWDGKAFIPRKLMPLALSYDHRAVNGGDAGRFLTYLVEQFAIVDNLQ
jgi:pyruvate dehydrogenase E2 component (dihydrolipoamide acetyltransferase)